MQCIIKDSRKDQVKNKTVVTPNLQPTFTCPVSFSLTVGSALSAPSVAGRCTPVTGCGGLGAACTTWPVSPVSPARGSCPPGRSSPWWRRRCSAGSITTACWTISSGPWRKVSRPGPTRVSSDQPPLLLHSFNNFFSFYRFLFLSL